MVTHPMRILALVLICLSVAACTGSTIKPSSHQDPSARAQQLRNDGAYREAAQEYLALASSRVSTPEQRARWQMDGVESLLQAGLVNEAEMQVQRIQTTENELRVRIDLARAQIAASRSQGSDALTTLSTLPTANLAGNQRLRYFQALALAQEAENQLLNAALSRMELDGLLRDGFERQTNQQALWDDLLRLSPEQLKQAGQQAQTGPSSRNGWLALALMVQTAPSAQLVQGLQHWQASFRAHPAQAYIVPMLQSGQIRQPTAIAGAQGPLNTLPGGEHHIALLLSFGDKFGAAAESVRDGFMAAWYAEPAQQRLPVKVYNVSAETAAAAYDQALKQGAVMVAGPLQKNILTELVKAYSQFPVPTVAMNRLDEQAGQIAPRNLYQFALAPEDEAIAAADKAWADGYRVAGAVIPSSAWGARVLSAFVQHWQQLGGRFAVSGEYSNSNFSSAVKTVARTSGLDVVFMLAYPTEARQLRPQFDYHYASHLPLYASSHIYAGSPSPSLDQDLNGIMFADIPWMLNGGYSPDPVYQNLAAQWPDKMQSATKRLYALGVDTYRLLMHLNQYGLAPGQTRISGATGELSLDTQGVVHRQLSWAVFEHGSPRLIHAETPQPTSNSTTAIPTRPAAAVY